MSAAKKLWRCDLNLPVFVMAVDEDDAIDQAWSHQREAIGDIPSGDWAADEAKHVVDLPFEWADSIQIFALAVHEATAQKELSIA